MTKWTPPLPVAELARTASRLAHDARHIEATWGELHAALSQRESARLGNLHIRLGASVRVCRGRCRASATSGNRSVENVLRRGQDLADRTRDKEPNSDNRRPLQVPNLSLAMEGASPA